jgi:hypothetical protein
MVFPVCFVFYSATYVLFTFTLQPQEPSHDGCTSLAELDTTNCPGSFTTSIIFVQESLFQCVWHAARVAAILVPP